MKTYRKIVSVLRMYLISYCFCTIIFALDPSLNLKKIIRFYSMIDGISISDLSNQAHILSLQGYVLSLIVISLTIYIFMIFVIKKLLISYVSIFLLLHFFVPLGFPNVFQVCMIWNKTPQSLQVDINRYKWFITWQMEWITMLLISIKIHYMLRIKKTH